MELFIKELLGHPLFGLFLVITLGLALGKIKVGGLALDVAGVIFVALIAGHFGLVVPAIFQQLGLVLFVYTVGIQAGPNLGSAFSKQGLPLALGTVVITLASLGINQGLTLLFNIDSQLAIGLLTGARSSNSALAVTVESGLPGPTLGHSVAYPLGVLSAMIFVRLLPLITGRNLQQEDKKHQERMMAENPPLESWTVSYGGTQPTKVRNLGIPRDAGITIARIANAQGIVLPRADLVIHPGDHLRLVGPQEAIPKSTTILGPLNPSSPMADLGAVDDGQQQGSSQAGDDIEARWITVLNRNLINKPLGRAALVQTYGATVTRIQRNGLEIAPSAWRMLRYGDRLMVVARASQMKDIKSYIGASTQNLQRDFLPMTLAIVLGLAVGAITLPLGGLAFSLGTTGGVLVTSLVLSGLGRTGRVLWHISDSSLRFVSRLGLVFFLASVGTNAGSSLVSILLGNGPLIIVVILSSALVPLALAAWIGLVVFKLNLLVVMGMVSGGTTCSPALGVISAMTPSTVPTVAYATTFPLAMIAMMVVVHILSLGV